jgi:hypothetical protein
MRPVRPHFQTVRVQGVVVSLTQRFMRWADGGCMARDERIQAAIAQ